MSTSHPRLAQRSGTLTGNLYKYTNTTADNMLVLSMEKRVNREENGYAVISRKWKKGDKLQLGIPMNVQSIASRSELKTNNSG